MSAVETIEKYQAEIHDYADVRDILIEALMSLAEIIDGNAIATSKIDQRVKALEVSKREPATEKRLDPFATEYCYEIVSPGEPAACIPPLYDTVTVTVESGNPGGDDGEFEEYMRKAVAEWYDTPDVKLVAIGTKDAKPQPAPTDEELEKEIADLIRAWMGGTVGIEILVKDIIAEVRRG